MRASLIFLSCVLLAACSGDDEGKPSPGGGGSDNDDVTALRGAIKSVAGEPLSGVKVRGGGSSATSGADGRYELRASAGEETPISFELDGYVSGFRSATLLLKRPTQLDIALLPLGEAVQIDAAAGGMAEGKRGARVMVPAGAFVDGEGKPVSGMVDVYVTPLDPGMKSERAAAPTLLAENDGDKAPLESFG